MRVAIRKDTCDCCGRGDELKYTIRILPTPEFMMEPFTDEQFASAMCEVVRVELYKVMTTKNGRN